MPEEIELDANGAAPSAVQTEDAKSAENSSNSDDADAKKPAASMLEVVQATLDESESQEDDEQQEDGEGSPSGPESESDSESKSEDEPKTDEGKSEDEDEEEQPPFHEHKAWKRQVEKRKAAETELEAMKPIAAEYQAIQQFMGQQNLNTEEVAQGYQIMAMIKNDPARAHDELSKVMKSLAPYVGGEIPDDLREKVDSGEVDEETAAELTKARAQAKLAQDRLKQQGDNVAKSQAQDVRLRMVSAVNEWEIATRSNDPDYGSKQQFVTDRLGSLSRANPPRSAEDAVKLAKQAYDEVSQNLGKRAPAKKPIDNPLSSSSSKNTAAGGGQAPQSMLEAVQREMKRWG